MTEKYATYLEEARAAFADVTIRENTAYKLDKLALGLSCITWHLENNAELNKEMNEALKNIESGIEVRKV